MNEEVVDMAFQPVDANKVVADKGVQPDGSVRYEVVEGNVYLNDQLVGPVDGIDYVQVETKTEEVEG